MTMTTSTSSNQRMKATAADIVVVDAGNHHHEPQEQALKHLRRQIKADHYESARPHHQRRLHAHVQSIVESTGSGFLYGTLFGGAVGVFEGIQESPKHQRVRGVLHHAKEVVPQTAGRIAIVTCVFRCVATVLEEWRGKNDMWNVLVAAPTAGALLQARKGPKAALQSAFFFGSVGAIIVGFNKAETKIIHHQVSPEEVLEEVAFAEEFE